MAMYTADSALPASGGSQGTIWRTRRYNISLPSLNIQPFICLLAADNERTFWHCNMGADVVLIWLLLQYPPILSLHALDKEQSQFFYWNSYYTHKERKGLQRW